MNPPAAELAREAALLELFERDYASWLTSRASGDSPAELQALWKRALQDPIRNFLERPGKQFRAGLVRSSWLLAGGADEDLPLELQMMIEVLHAGSLIIDDIQDSSQRRRGQPALHRLVGVPIAINTGNLLYCWALELLSHAKLEPSSELALHRRTAHAMLACHQGQALDLTLRACDLPPEELPALVMRSTELKAGTLLELAAELGAIGAAGAAPARDGTPARADADIRVRTLARFGRALGVALQMLDDLSGLVNAQRREKAREDLRLSRPTWVWSWLASDLDRNVFTQLQRRARRVFDGADPEPLIDELGARLAHRARERVHEHLQSALFPLAQQFGEGPQAEHLAALRAEVQRLEQSYV